MSSVMAVGLESTLDTWVTFPTLASFEEFASEYEGSLAEQVGDAYSAVNKGVGGEVPIDGKTDEVRELVKAADSWGAEVKHALGGNGAQEAAALKALGAEVAFTGYVPSSLSEIPSEDKKHFEASDLSSARKSSEKPTSVILQTPGTNRYVLCEGRGRRINQLRQYLSELPEILRQVLRNHGGLDMVNLVGWHVVFANGMHDQDFRQVKNVVDKIRNVTDSPLFTDAGSLKAFDERETKLLYEIYSLFDYLSVNDEEALQLSRAIGGKAEDEFQAMHNLLKSSEKLSTVWLHSLNYQASLSTRHGGKLLEKVQRNAAAAGVYRVEKGTYPNPEELAKRRDVKNYAEKGLRTAKKITNKYADEARNAELVATPCYAKKKFTTSVGAGDTAAAAYTHTIAGAEGFQKIRKT